MTEQSSGWQAPLTPWKVVEKRFFEGQAPDVDMFSGKYSVPVETVRSIFTGSETAFPADFCEALARETGMSAQFFKNLSDRHQAH